MSSWNGEKAAAVDLHRRQEQKIELTTRQVQKNGFHESTCAGDLTKFAREPHSFRVSVTIPIHGSFFYSAPFIELVT